METFRDPIWQFVGIALGLVSIGVAVAIAWGQRRFSQISFDFYVVPLVKVHPHAEGRVAVLLDGAIVDTAALCYIRLWNSGNQPIQAADFVEPLVFDLGEGIRAFSQDVHETSPPDLVVNLNPLDPSQHALSRNSVRVEPLLLNPGDMFSISVLTEGEAFPSLRGRIVGVKRFVRIDMLRRSLKKGFYRGLATGFVSSLAVSFGLFFLVKRFLGPYYAARAVGTGFLFLLLLAIFLFARGKSRSNAD